MRQFLEVESAHYPDLEIFVASEGQSRFDLYNEGIKVDTITVYKWDIESVRKFLSDLGLERDESRTWDKLRAEADLVDMLNNPVGGNNEKPKEDL